MMIRLYYTHAYIFFNDNWEAQSKTFRESLKFGGELSVFSRKNRECKFVRGTEVFFLMGQAPTGLLVTSLKIVPGH